MLLVKHQSPKILVLIQYNQTVVRRKLNVSLEHLKPYSKQFKCFCTRQSTPIRFLRS